MALTFNHFSNVWSLGATELVGTELPLADLNDNPNIGTYGFRTIGVPTTSVTASQKGGAYLTAVNGDVNRATSEVLWLEPLVQLACTFQDTGDTVTRAKHGFVNNDKVSFASIATTTGISALTEYYVISATTNTFQVSTTQGGSAVTLTNNGTGVILPWYESGVMVRGSGAATSETAYLCWFDTQSSNLCIGKFSAGTWTTLAFVNYSIPTDNACDYYIRFRANGSSLKARIWPYYNYEPASWTLQTTDGSITAAGYVGFWFQALTASKAGFNTPGFISVATNGQTAPMPKSDREINTWLRDEGNPRVILADIGVLGKAPVSVTFQDTGDTVTYTAHGLVNGNTVKFTSITTTTGISVETTYYVVNKTNDTFQVATSAGGAALPLTTNGSGLMLVLSSDPTYEENPSYALVSNWPHLTGPNESPASQCYDDIIVDVPTLRSQASDSLVGRSSMSYGDLVIDNSDGQRDHWLTWNWDGRDFDLYVGGVGWRKWDFQRVLTGTVQEIYAPSRNQLGFKLRDKSAVLNRVLQDEKINEGDVNDGNFKPIVFGQVFNIEPVLVDTASRTYMVHTGSLTGSSDITAVRDGGISVGTHGVDWTKTLASGIFTLAAAPEYRVTCDVTNVETNSSAKESGNTHRRALQTIAEDRIGMGTRSTYQGTRNGSLANFGTTATIGLFLKGDENALNMLDQIATSAGGFWYFNSLGLLCAQQLTVPTSPYEHELIEDDVVDFTVQRLILPSEVEQLGYQRNWTVQKDGLALAITAANRALYGAQAQYTAITPTYSGLDQPSKHNLRRRPRPRDTLFYNISDANTEATRLDALYRKVTAVVSFKPVVDGLKYDLGQSLKLTHSRYGFSAGKAGIIVGIEKNFSKATAVVKMFVQYDGAFPMTSSSAPYVPAEEFY